jgi:hypothetical protein
MEFWNIGFKTEKKFLPNIPSFQLSSVPRHFFQYSKDLIEDFIHANDVEC